MLSIRTNFSSVNANNQVKHAQFYKNLTIERLSTGKRINAAKDDAAGISQTTRLTAEIRSLEIASRNVADAQAVISVAEGAHHEILNILLRMRELAMKNANALIAGTNNETAERLAIVTEVKALESTINKIADTTNYGGKSLNSSQFIFQIGAKKGEQIIHNFKNLNMNSTAAFSTIIGFDISLTFRDFQGHALTMLDNAISVISTRKGELGALSNRLESQLANLGNIFFNLKKAKGRILDTDFALETTKLAKHQIAEQAGIAIAAQTNASANIVLQLLN